MRRDLSFGDERAETVSGNVAGSWRHRFQRRHALGALLLLAVLVLTHRLLLVGFAQQFRVDDPARSDAIVLLMGDFRGERALRAAELYRQGLARWILVGATPNTADRCNVLREHGVPAEAIRVMGGVKSTRDEALRTRDSLASLGGARRVTVVTTSFHTARARWIFDRVLRARGVEVRTAATRDPRFHESDWYTSRVGIRSYFWEVIKTVFYRMAY